MWVYEALGSGGSRRRGRGWFGRLQFQERRRLVAQPGSGSPGSDGAVAASGTLTVYNAQHEALTQEWADAFTEQTGITVTIRNGTDTELANQIVQEGDALAGRRVPHRELARDGPGGEGRPVRAGRRGHA